MIALCASVTAAGNSQRPSLGAPAKPAASRAAPLYTDRVPVNYIGSKRKLLSFLEEEITARAGSEPREFCDLFAGTGVVGARFKELGWRVTSADLQVYSYRRLQALIELSSPPEFRRLAQRGALPALKGSPLAGRTALVCDHLSSLAPRDGFIFRNYCAGGARRGEQQRMYFSDRNGRRADAIRSQIAEWRAASLITELEEAALIAALLAALDRVANTASVYGAFLKKLKKTAQSELDLRPLELIPSAARNRALLGDANQLIGGLSGDVLYLDPPYNTRQYAANYHVLETIARWDNPTLRGVTGLRDWSDQKSDYSSKSAAREALSGLISAADFKWIFLSYNNEGILSLDEIREILSSRGRYGKSTRDYKRFRADLDSSARSYKGDSTIEYLHWVECE